MAALGLTRFEQDEIRACSTQFIVNDFPAPAHSYCYTNNYGSVGGGNCITTSEIPVRCRLQSTHIVLLEVILAQKSQHEKYICFGLNVLARIRCPK